MLAGIATTGVLNIIQQHGIVTDARILIGFLQILSQSTNVLGLTMPNPVPLLVGFVKLLFLDLRRVVMLDCWAVGGFYGKLIVNIFVVPVLIGGICGLTYIYRRKKTLQAIIVAGAADASALDVLKVQLQQNLFLCIFLVCESQPIFCTQQSIAAHHHNSLADRSHDYHNTLSRSDV